MISLDSLCVFFIVVCLYDAKIIIFRCYLIDLHFALFCFNLPQRIPWGEIGLVPPLIAHTICEYLEYLPQSIVIKFDSIVNQTTKTDESQGASSSIATTSIGKSKRSRVFVDCIDFHDDWIMIHENRKNVSYCRCIKLCWNEILDAVENNIATKEFTIVV